LPHAAVVDRLIELLLGPHDYYPHIPERVRLAFPDLDPCVLLEEPSGGWAPRLPQLGRSLRRAVARVSKEAKPGEPLHAVLARLAAERTATGDE
jgi:hypothetical protein